MWPSRRVSSNHNAHGPSSYANDPLAIAPHSDQIDVIFAAVDGGGLVAGIADYVKRIGSPHTKVTGVEGDGSPAVCVWHSLNFTPRTNGITFDVKWHIHVTLVITTCHWSKQSTENLFISTLLSISPSFFPRVELNRQVRLLLWIKNKETRRLCCSLCSCQRHHSW